MVCKTHTQSDQLDAGSDERQGCCELTLPALRDAVVWPGSGQDAFTQIPLQEQSLMKITLQGLST